ncbi:hypothetical protein [Curtobacterium luteum]|uniref:Uncharacterized protein n=1 Tax=Curtobacterium luteum TaxID=33881 RepID=A0A175S0F8_9MICO|nr:hypothetical protein [Curtobacterium luteum]KTR09547.1 hypothetical protein NS184_02725 [Curtobacterium luteum]
MLNADVAVDRSLDSGDVLARLDKISNETGYTSYTVLGVPTYLVQLSLVRQLIEENLTLVITLLGGLTISMGMIAAFLNQLLQHRRLPVAHAHYILGKSPSHTNRLFGASRFTEYTAVLGAFLAISALLPNNSDTARLSTSVVLLLWCAADALLQGHNLRTGVTVHERRGTVR